MASIEIIGFLIASGLFFLLALLSFYDRPKRRGGVYLTYSLLLTGAWAAMNSAHSFGFNLSPMGMWAGEIARSIFWGTLVWALVVGESTRGNFIVSVRREPWPHFLFISFIVIVVALNFGKVDGGITDGSYFELIVSLIVSVAALVAVEQLARSIVAGQYWVFKFLFLGVGGLLVYDLLIYSDALVNGRVDEDLWGARGVIAVICACLIATAMYRSRTWSVDRGLSHRMAFNVVAVIAGAIYVVFVVLIAVYFHEIGGEKGGIIQAVLLFAAVILFLLLFFSGQIRAYLKVYLAKNFFAYKYDYREQWIRFIRALSVEDSERGLEERAIRAIADIVESPGGILWMYRGADRVYVPVSQWNMNIRSDVCETKEGALAAFLERWQWVINISEYRSGLDIYQGLQLPKWIDETGSAWLIVPLMRQTELVGFVVLAHSRAGDHFNWEDIDLLRIAGRELASYLALNEANKALIDARQFDAFNRLSAYIVHDLKNVAAQLSLVGENAKKFRGKPEFVDDAFDTVGNAVARMNRMLSQLRGEEFVLKDDTVIEVSSLLQDMGRNEWKSGRPTPTIKATSGLYIMADYDRLRAVIGHLVQNAQEATADSGVIEVSLENGVEWADIIIRDNGCGMDEQFMRERLFRPFETTKGNAGMGIGVYEAREFIHSLGGSVRVSSEPGRGTEFHLRIPQCEGAGRD